MGPGENPLQHFAGEFFLQAIRQGEFGEKGCCSSATLTWCSGPASTCLSLLSGKTL